MSRQILAIVVIVAGAAATIGALWGPLVSGGKLTNPGFLVVGLIVAGAIAALIRERAEAREKRHNDLVLQIQKDCDAEWSYREQERLKKYHFLFLLDENVRWKELSERLSGLELTFRSANGELTVSDIWWEEKGRTLSDVQIWTKYELDKRYWRSPAFWRPSAKDPVAGFGVVGQDWKQMNPLGINCLRDLDRKGITVELRSSSDLSREPHAFFWLSFESERSKNSIEVQGEELGGIHNLRAGKIEGFLCELKGDEVLRTIRSDFLNSCMNKRQGKPEEREDRDIVVHMQFNPDDVRDNETVITIDEQPVIMSLFFPGFPPGVSQSHRK